MKKSIIVLAAAALVLAVGCNDTKSVELNKDAEIAVSPFVKGVVASKALVNGTELPTQEDLQVFGYFDSASPENTPVSAAFNIPYINDKCFSFEENGVWRGKGQKYYWPKTGSIVFAGYHGDANVSYVPADEQVMTITDYNSQAIDGGHVLPGDFCTQDLMYIPVTANSYNKTNGTNGVPVVMYHALSWLSFQAVANEAADGQFRIDSIFINTVLRDGDAVIKGTQSSHTCAWAAKAPEVTLVQFKGTGSADPSEQDNYVVRYNDGKPQAFGYDFVVIPQAATTLTIYYSQYAPGYGKWVAMAPATVEMAKLVEAGTTIKISKWEPAKHYTYTISFNFDASDEITIAPSVAPWEEVTVDPYNI